MKGKYKKRKMKSSSVLGVQQKSANFDVQMMNPDVITIGRIYETSNYDLFHLMDENREVHISSRLYNLIETQGQLTPIVVDANFNVYDGQHRLVILKELKRPVIFVVNTLAKSYDMIAMNAAQRNWSDMDYINYYITNGYGSYELLLKTYEEYKDVVSLKSMILYLSDSTGNAVFEHLKYGSYKIKNYENTINFLNYLREFKLETNLSNVRTWVSDSLRKMYVKPTFDGKRMINKFNEKGLSGKPSEFSGREQTMETLVLAYNDRLKEGHPKYLDYEYNKNKNVVLK